MISKTNRNRTASLNALRATLPSFVLALAGTGCGERYQLGEVAQELDHSDTALASIAVLIADGPEDADARLEGFRGSRLGGDVDGDGFDDWKTDRLVYGGPRPANGIITAPENVGPTFAVNDGNEELSTQITSPADIDGDGRSDLLFETSVGIHHTYAFEEGELAAETAESDATVARRWAAQRAFLWYGSTDRSATELELSDAAVSFGDRDNLVSRFTAELTERQHPADAYFDALQTLRLTALGDIDADGFDDFALSSTFSWSSLEEQQSDGIHSILTGERSESITYVYYGKSQRFARGVTPEPDARLDGIWLLAGVGDLNGDGYTDVQALTKTGAARLLPGSAQRLTGDIDVGNAAVEVANSPPQGLTALGDIDQDGFDDFVVIWDYDNVSTRHHLFYGSPSLLQEPLDRSAASAVFAVQGPVVGFRNIGDWNGDGYADIFMMNSRLTTNSFDDDAQNYAGAELRILPGSAARYSGLHEITAFRPGASQSDPFVIGANLVGDIDGDGHADLFFRTNEIPQFTTYVKYGGPLLANPDIY